MPAFSLTSYLLTALGPYARRLWFAAAALCVLALGTLGLVRRSHNLVRVGDADGIFTVTQLSPITVEFTMPQSALPVLQHLSAGGANAAVHAHARDGGAPLAQGRLLG